MTFRDIELTIEDPVAILRLNRPDKLNAFTYDTLREIRAAIDACVADTRVVGIVITGNGRGFCAGLDAATLAAVTSAPAEPRAADPDTLPGIFSYLLEVPKPVIAAINGVCLGGGLELAMACHLRICGDRARLGQPEINLGIIPGWGGTQRLARIVGPAKATELILTGDQITAQQAMQLRLVNMVVPGGEVMRQAKGLAAKIANKSAVAVAAAMTAIRAGLDADLPTGLAAERTQFDFVLSSEDAREGITAFLEKREAKFSDK